MSATESVETGTYNIVEAAAFLGVSQTTVRRMIDADGFGAASPRRIGRQWRFSRRRLAQWLDGDIDADTPEIRSTADIRRALGIVS